MLYKRPNAGSLPSTFVHCSTMMSMYYRVPQGKMYSLNQCLRSAIRMIFIIYFFFKFLRSLEQFIQTVKVHKIFWFQTTF